MKSHITIILAILPKTELKVDFWCLL